jgi:shikimate kinase
LRAIALVGMPGSGKSTVGRHVAKRLQVDFVDADHAIEQRLGETIRSFFEREGEPAFRELEAQVIADLVATHHGVIATGGGTVLRPENRVALKSGSTVVYLRSHPDDLFRRLRRDTQRPLLQVDDPMARLRALHAERDPLYREVAHFTVDTGRPSIAALVNMIVMQLELAGLPVGGPGEAPR